MSRRLSSVLTYPKGLSPITSFFWSQPITSQYSYTWYTWYTSYSYFEFLIKYCFTLKNHDLIWQNLAKNEEKPCANNLLLPPISQNPAKFQLSNHYNTVWHAAALGKYFCRFLVEKWADDVMPCVPRDKSL